MSTTDKKQTLYLEYDLFELPTARHKAGLAGLLLIIESMKRRRMTTIPVIRKLTPTSVYFAFTRKSMQVLFDYLYAASGSKSPQYNNAGCSFWPSIYRRKSATSNRMLRPILTVGSGPRGELTAHRVLSLMASIVAA